MNTDKPITISLTSKNSHVLKISAGQGSLSIGTTGMDKKKFDILVDDNLPINWNCFNELFTGYGKVNSHLHPYGDWPRYFNYSGNDIGFTEWSKKRQIEGFQIHPNKPISIDLKDTLIDNLDVEAIDSAVIVTLGNHLSRLHLSGNLEYFSIIATNENPDVCLTPKTSKDIEMAPLKLPDFKSLHTITTLEIAVEPLGQAFDCESLLQFTCIEDLSLTGNITNLDCLKNFENLKRLSIRYSPNLENCPSLNTWKNLESFIGWNIDQKIGERLKAELKLLSKEKELDYSSVSQLRNSIWFITEYGIPFSNWETKNARIATKAYKIALKEINKAKTLEEVRIAITQLIQTINTLPNIETVEREDAGIAVHQLIEASSLNISQETGNKWFDEIRDF